MAVGAGSRFVNRRGRLQDAFRARVLFPICDPSGQPVALGGRVLPGQPRPGQVQELRRDADLLQAPDALRPQLGQAGRHRDRRGGGVRGVHRRDRLFGGGRRAGRGHLRHGAGRGALQLLRNFANRVVLAFDADGAGQAAAGRFYEWERRLEVDVAVAALPAGTDPAELARTDPEALRAAIDEAKPFLHFRVERILDAAELATPEGRAQAADAALAAVAEHPDDLVRDQYLMQVAERCRLEPRLLRDRLEHIRQEGPRSEPTPTPGPAVSPRPRMTRVGPSGRGDRQGRGPWVREPDGDGGWDADGFDGGGADRANGGRGPVARSGTPAARGPRVVPPASSGPGSRRSGWPSTGPRTWPTGWRRSCSVTICNGRRSSVGRRRPDPSTRPSTWLRRRCGPCWSV